MKSFSFLTVCILFGLQCNAQHAHLCGHRVLTRQSIESLWSRTIYLQHHFCLFYHQNKTLQKIVLKHKINLQTLNCQTDLANMFLVHTQSLFFYSVTPSYMKLHTRRLNCFVQNTVKSLAETRVNIQGVLQTKTCH